MEVVQKLKFPNNSNEKYEKYTFWHIYKSIFSVIIIVEDFTARSMR